MPAKLAPSTRTSASKPRAGSAAEDMHLAPHRGGEARRHHLLGLLPRVPRAAVHEHQRLALEPLGALDELVDVGVAPRADLVDAAPLVPRGDLVHQHLARAHPRLAIEGLDLRVAGHTEDVGDVGLGYVGAGAP